MKFVAQPGGSVADKEALMGQGKERGVCRMF